MLTGMRRKKATFSSAKGHVMFGLCLVAILVCSAAGLAETTTGYFVSFSAPNQRWKNLEDELYCADYREAYSYGEKADAGLTYTNSSSEFSGLLNASDLKPHFVYQVKLQGYGTTASDLNNDTDRHNANEALGYAGRWWREEWDGDGWTDWQNVDDNDYDTYHAITDDTSETGLKYRYVGYMIASFFITDGNGDVSHEFMSNRSYHVLWREAGDVSEPDSVTTTPVYRAPAYCLEGDTWTVYPEKERSSEDFENGVFLRPGGYECQVVLTEESFHYSGEYDGYWATVMGADIAFEIVPPPTGDLLGTVTDADTGDAIAGATVSADSGDATETAPDGSYALTLPAGERQITVSMDGYETRTDAVTVPEDGQATLDVALIKSQVEDGTVLVGYEPRAGGKHLNVTVTVLDHDGNRVNEASVEAVLLHNGGSYTVFSGITDSTGTFSVSFNHVPAGYYTTEVNSVLVEDIEWTVVTEDPGFDNS